MILKHPNVIPLITDHPNTKVSNEFTIYTIGAVSLDKERKYLELCSQRPQEASCNPCTCIVMVRLILT